MTTDYLTFFESATKDKAEFQKGQLESAGYLVQLKFDDVRKVWLVKARKPRDKFELTDRIKL